VAENKTGGIIAIFVRGNVNISASSSIEARGGNGDGCTYNGSWNVGGGASGGGSILFLHKGTFTNGASGNSNFIVSGGIRGPTGATANTQKVGGTGGNGSFIIDQID
jgi:hypothetical protein